MYNIETINSSGNVQDTMANVASKRITKCNSNSVEISINATH